VQVNCTLCAQDTPGTKFVERIEIAAGSDEKNDDRFWVQRATSTNGEKVGKYRQILSCRYAQESFDLE
jgi:hypothetical protein